jgi:exopolyphosphatase/guanosine-5'-triphosphate,3'-diphosphate pyrophosphatase
MQLLRPGLLALALCALPPAPGRAGAAPRAPICAIDMGSNSFKRIVGSYADGRYEQKAFEKQTLGVGDDLSRHGRISDAKLAEIEAALAAFRARCERDGAARVVAVGTAAFREAPNGARVVEIAAKLGIPMEIASEQRESELAYLVGSLGEDGIAVIDNGSRTIELVSKQAGEPPRFSVSKLGYRIAWQDFFAGAETAASAAAAYRERLGPEAQRAAALMRGQRRLVGVEFDEMAEVLFPGQESEGRVFPLAELQRRLREIEASGAAGFAELKRLQDIDRALPRLVVAVAFTEAFGYPELAITARELGAGLIVEAGRAGR